MGINLKKQVHGEFENVVDALADELKISGFGVLTRIDLHKKIKEKLNKDIPRVVILGACNPELAFEAYQKNTDIASLLPCNAVIRELERDIISIEIVKPTFLMNMIGEKKLEEMAFEADKRLKRVIDSFAGLDEPYRAPLS
jgi:uncharacterized protein (DUF302 family)